MNDFLAKRYFRGNPRINVYPVSVQVAFTLVLPADPDRFLIATTSNTAQVLGYTWGESASGVAQVQYQTQAGPWYLSEDDVGGLITLPLWIKSGTGAVNVQIVTCSYEPQKRRIMDAFVARFLSDAGTS